jgi:hypothetical protein
MVELQPSKLMMRVRLPLPAPGKPRVREDKASLLRGVGRGIQTGQTGTTARSEFRSGRQPKKLAHIAQLVEHFLGKEEATGSSPVVSTKGQGRTSKCGATTTQDHARLVA